MNLHLIFFNYAFGDCLNYLPLSAFLLSAISINITSSRPLLSLKTTLTLTIIVRLLPPIGVIITRLKD